jgi:hypothetical protein
MKARDSFSFKAVSPNLKDGPKQALLVYGLHILLFP